MKATTTPSPAHASRRTTFERRPMPVTKTRAAIANVTIAEVPSIPPTSARPSTLNDRPNDTAMTTRLGVVRDPFQSARARATIATPMSTGSTAIANAAAATTTPTHHRARAPMRTISPVPTARRMASVAA
jgi:hypothetical protein